MAQHWTKLSSAQRQYAHGKPYRATQKTEDFNKSNIEKIIIRNMIEQAQTECVSSI